MHSVTIKNFSIGSGNPLAVISGPCVIEGEEQTLYAAEVLKKIFLNRGMALIFKSSYDKANRSSIASYRGPGLQEGLRILERVYNEFDLPVLTDVHTPEEARAAAEVCDVIQIPAFLSRQTDLLVAAALTGKVVNVKKGQFMAPWDMRHVVEKLRQSGNERILLTDRGTSFGYNNLVSDMRAIPVMQDFGTPVCFDATHSVQLPGGKGETSGGERHFVPLLAKSAVAAGCDCLFMESHPDPERAKSDADSQVAFNDLPELLDVLERTHAAVQPQKKR